MPAASITLFSNLTAPTGPELDNNFLAYAVFGMIPCTVSGSNALTLVQRANTPALTQLTQGIQFSAVAALTNTGAVTALIGSFGTLNVYKDSLAGPIALTGGEIIAGNAFSLRYDSALNSGAGGYHITTNTAIVGGTISGSLANLALLNGTLAVYGSLGSTGNSLTSTQLSGSSLSIVALSASASIASIANATLSSLQVGVLGSTLATVTRMVSALATLTFTVSAANSVQDQNMVVAGAQVRDPIILGIGSSASSGAGFTGFCGTLGTVTVRLINPSTVTLGATTMTVRAMGIGVTP